MSLTPADEHPLRPSRCPRRTGRCGCWWHWGRGWVCRPWGQPHLAVVGRTSSVGCQPPGRRLWSRSPLLPPAGCSLPAEALWEAAASGPPPDWQCWLFWVSDRPMCGSCWGAAGSLKKKKTVGCDQCVVFKLKEKKKSQKVTCSDSFCSACWQAEATQRGPRPRWLADEQRGLTSDWVEEAAALLSQSGCCGNELSW